MSFGHLKARALEAQKLARQKGSAELARAISKFHCDLCEERNGLQYHKVDWNRVAILCELHSKLYLEALEK